MAFAYTDVGRNFIEVRTVDDSVTDTMDTIAIGDGNGSPNSNDTSLDNNLYEADASNANVTIERGSATGEIRGVIEFTGGNEVPAGASITEIGFKSSGGTLVYREVRSSSVDVNSGESRVLEIRIFIEDDDSEPQQTITNVGREAVADILIGESSDHLNTISVGDGTNSVSPSDTTMQSELYRNDNSNSNTILTTTNNDGEIRAEITISAGTDFSDEVPTDSQISEFGLFTNDGTLLLHETRTAVILQSNDSKTFKIPLTIT